MSIVASNPSTVKARKPPRPPQSWEYDPHRQEVKITDCCGESSVYRIAPVPADTGSSWELINVDSRFGECRTVHLGPADKPCGELCDDCCDCAGWCFRESCKHLHVILDLVASGHLVERKAGAR
jgi:hypothetical protein